MVERSPVRTTAMMCGAGQRKEGGWDKGSKGWRCEVALRRERKSKDAGGAKMLKQKGRERWCMKFKLQKHIFYINLPCFLFYPVMQMRMHVHEIFS